MKWETIIHKSRKYSKIRNKHYQSQSLIWPFGEFELEFEHKTDPTQLKLTQHIVTNPIISLFLVTAV